MIEIINENLGNARLMILSCIGENHINIGIENQDSYSYKTIDSQNYAFAVADGVGSCECAKKGSETACEVICDLLDKIDGKSIDNIKTMIFSEWKNRIGCNWNNYCTTLNFCFVLKDSIIVGKVGDGTALIKIGDDYQILSNESEFYTNETFALAEMLPKAAFSIQKIEYSFNKPFSVLLMTDGIYKEIENDKIKSFADYIFSNIENKNFVVELEDWVTGLNIKNGDDKTILMCSWEKK